MSQTEQDRPSVLRAARERTRAEITRQILDAARRHLATEEASGLCLCPLRGSEDRERLRGRRAPGDRGRPPRSSPSSCGSLTSSIKA